MFYKKMKASTVLNKWEKTFLDMLWDMEFSIDASDPNENGTYNLLDYQGAYLGGIAEERFNTARQVVEGLDTYIKDYFVDWWIDKYKELYPDTDNVPASGDEVLELARADEKYKEEIKLSIPILELIVEHIDDVNLDTCYQEIKKWREEEQSWEEHDNENLY